MKLHKVLTVNDQIYPLVNDETYLSLTTPGRASFTIESENLITGLVSLDIGYNTNPLNRFFKGVIENCTQTNTNEVKLLVREFSYVLSDKLLLNLRHCTLKDLADEMATITGLKFKLPDVDYIYKKVAFFYNIGTGFNALDTIGEVFGINDFIWQQEGNGDIYIGSWIDSYWGKAPNIDIPTKFFKDYQSTGMASIGCIPQLRPGAQFNNGARITQIILQDSDMTIKWKR